ncbi:LodA/GoxA family CTQ-dependent oxidase [Aromatoleum anaerobium]|uniref:L-lysine epsilon oxidase C-terminal domain-containing protein n=1 Tax=Aromatoleum anaerobium TaxID=182180 RepID=A0ABX1PTG9_9RHOO|nr:LodA/GoxA family CTQ-dependent oxidase [Aromatoleum anaerobium]
MEKAVDAATTFFMPPLSGDEGTRVSGQVHSWLSLTYLQYARMKAWLQKDKGWGQSQTAKVEPHLLEDGSIHPSVLTRALLDRACGGAFFPGIEVTAIVRDPKLYAEAFRFDHNVLEPGDVTKYMACPWQADFYECKDAWWPAQRPDDVVHEDSFKKIFDEFDEDALAGTFERALGERQPWARGVGDAVPRASGTFLMEQVLPEIKKGETFGEYAERLANTWLGFLAGAASV